MDNRKNERFSPPAVGGISLLVVFAVLCLTVFALLALSTVRADNRLADASAQAVADYYAADCQAQEVLARLRSGQRPEDVKFQDHTACYTVPISSTQELQVEVELTGEQGKRGGSWRVIRWQAVPSGAWEGDDSLSVWDGT